MKRLSIRLVALSCLLGLLLSAGLANAAEPASKVDVEAKAKELTAKLCNIYMTGDRAGFEAFLHSSLNKKENMRYWWDVNGKGGDYRKLFTACAFSRLDPASVPARIRAFVQRTPKKAGTSMPAPVAFQPDPEAGGEYKITSCSI